MLEELIYSVKKDKEAYAFAENNRIGVEKINYELTKDIGIFSDDSSKANSWVTICLMLEKVIPPASEAKGCRKSVRRESTSVSSPEIKRATVSLRPLFTLQALIKRRNLEMFSR